MINKSIKKQHYGALLHLDKCLSETTKHPSIIQCISKRELAVNYTRKTLKDIEDELDSVCESLSKQRSYKGKSPSEIKKEIVVIGDRYFNMYVK